MPNMPDTCKVVTGVIIYWVWFGIVGSAGLASLHKVKFKGIKDVLIMSIIAPVLGGIAALIFVWHFIDIVFVGAEYKMVMEDGKQKFKRSIPDAKL